MRKGLLIWAILMWQIAAAQRPVALLETKGYTFPAALDASSNEIPEVTVAFQIVDGLLVVEAQADGVKGRYLLDTGAPTLVLHQQENTSGDVSARGITGEVTAAAAQIDRFEWAGQIIKKPAALSLDISHLQEDLQMPLAGLIGYDVLKNAELFADVNNGQLQLFPTRKSDLHRLYTPLAVIPFDMAEHLPVITIQIKGRSFRMILDTGSGANLLDHGMGEWLLQSGYSICGTETLQGLNGNIQRSDIFAVPQSSSGNFNMQDLRFSLSDMQTLSQHLGQQVDGILGFPFLKTGRFSINYQRKELYVW